ncbi:MAG: right-handed parallel beta-helix repeat-containing protein [Candidatus Krumholzibacteriota bacterium]|nr:right-handed parallel beta-helix repeat-containing protein [Candidatus Krumholzibacteriota bacterium]
MTLKNLLLLLLILSSFSSAGAQQIWTVNDDGSGDAPTIQAAIDSTVEGDRVRVNGGTYYETGLVIDGKNIWIISGDGIPVIESPEPGIGTCLTLRNVNFTCAIWGIKPTGFETGILVDDCSPMVSFLVLSGSVAGIRVTGTSSAPEISFDLIESCDTGVSIEGGSGITVRNMTIVEGGTGISVSGGNVSISNNILYRQQTGIACTGGASIITCNDLWENTVDYDGCAQGAGDFFEMPRFCYEAGDSPGLYYLHVDSPCWAANNSCGVNLGAFTSAPGCSGVAVRESTWGVIKQLYTE